MAARCPLPGFFSQKALAVEKDSGGGLRDGPDVDDGGDQVSSLLNPVEGDEI